MRSTYVRRVGRAVGALGAIVALSVPASASTAPTIEVAAGWNQPVGATAGGYWTTTDGGTTIQGKANADYPALANLQTGYCDPYGAGTQIVGASLTRVRWHANANDMSAYMRFLTPAGVDLGVAGGLTSLLSTRRYLYNYAPEGINLQLPTANVTSDRYTFPGGQCVHAGVLFNGAGSDGVTDTPGWTPLVTSRLDTVTIEDLQGPSVTGPTSWATWITGDQAPIEWDQSDNGFNRGTTGASVVGGGTADLGDAANGHLGQWVGVGGLADGQHDICAYRTAGTGYAAASACTVFKLDRTDPSAPAITLTPDTAGGWTNQDVTIQTQATGDGTGSGWDRNQFSIDGAPFADGPSSFTRTAEGAVTLTARAVDKAGRVSGPSASRVARIDHTPPQAAASPGWIAAPTANPRIVTVSLPTLTDGVSGLATVDVLVNADPNGGQADAAFGLAGSVANPTGDVAVTLDLAGLDAGIHATRIVATDRAGNRLVAPGPAVSVPVGATITVTGGGALHVTELRSDVQIANRLVGGRIVPVVRGNYNRRFVLRGHLQQADGAAEAGAGVELRDSFGRYVTGARTDATGNFAIPARATVGGVWTLNRVGQTDRIPAAVLEVRPLVQVRMAMARGGGVRRLVVTGRLIPQAGAAGKAVQLQWLDDRARAWRPAANGRVGQHGRFRLTYRFRRPGGYTVAFRLTVPRDNGWPYLATTSRVVKVRVR